MSLPIFVGVNEVSEKIQIMKVSENGFLIQYINNPSESVQMAAIENIVFSIKYIDNQSEKAQLAAVKGLGKEYYTYIKNPTEKVKILYQILWVL